MVSPAFGACGAVAWRVAPRGWGQSALVDGKQRGCDAFGWMRQMSRRTRGCPFFICYVVLRCLDIRVSCPTADTRMPELVLLQLLLKVFELVQTLTGECG